MQPTYHTCAACFLRWFRRCSHQGCQRKINLGRDRKLGQRRHLWQQANWLNFLRMSFQRYGCTVSDRAVSSIINLEELTRQQVRVKDDDWTGKTDPAERRRRQNRLHQRAWRE
jgi:hypothetical protein